MTTIALILNLAMSLPAIVVLVVTSVLVLRAGPDPPSGEGRADRRGPPPPYDGLVVDLTSTLRPTSALH